jgi:MFS family permease
VSSAWCGLAPNAVTLVTGRIVEGLSSALMGPQVLAIIGVAYTGHARARAFNAFGLAVGMASVLGQLIGGALIRANVADLGWRACFLVNVPVGLVTLVLVPRLVPESRAPGRARLDPLGMLLVSAGLVAVVAPLAEGQQQGWPLWTWICLACSPVLLVAFAVQEHRLAAAGQSPLVNPLLFRQRSFTVGILTAIVYYSGIVSFFLVLALYLQHGIGLSALDSGLIFLPLGVTFVATSLNGPYLAARLGRQCLAVGAALVAVGLVAMWIAVSHIGTHGAVAWLVPGMMIDGAGMGMVMAPLASVALAGLDPVYAGAASGVLSTANQVGGAVGVAAIGIVFYRALASAGHVSAYAHAFILSVVVLIPLALAVLILVQFLPTAKKKASAPEPEPARM